MSGMPKDRRAVPKKPEILATPGSMDELESLVRAGADAVALGERRFGLRLAGEFPLPLFAEAVAFARERGVKVYALVNRIMDNRLAAELPEYLRKLADIGPDAVVFGDPAVVMALRGLGIAMPLHWDGEMTATNHAAAEFWGEKGAVRAVLARELNLDEIRAIRRQTGLEIEVQVHGATAVYHSRRRLIASYLEHRGLPVEDTGLSRGLAAIETERPDLRHPVFEDEDGTHILSADDICLLDLVPELADLGVDSFRIDGLLKPPDYNEAAVRAYRAAVDRYAASPEAYRPDPEWLESIRRLQDPGRELTYGFMFKEQIY